MARYEVYVLVLESSVDEMGHEEGCGRGLRIIRQPWKGDGSNIPD